MVDKFKLLLTKGNLIEAKSREECAYFLRDCIQVIDSFPDFVQKPEEAREILVGRIFYLLKSKYLAFLYTAKDWDIMPTNLPDVFIRKRPVNRKSPAYLSVEINPLDKKKRRKKRRGLFVHSAKDIAFYSEWLNKSELKSLFEKVKKLNSSQTGDLWTKLENEWDKVDTEIPGVSITKTPASKAFPKGKIMLEISPIDPDSNNPIKRKGLFIEDWETCQQFQRNLKDPEVKKLIDIIDLEINQNQQKVKFIYESKYLSFLRIADDWDSLNTDIKGVFIRKIPETKAMAAHLNVEINILDDEENRAKKRGLFLDNLDDLERYRKIFNECGLEKVFTRLENANQTTSGDLWDQIKAAWDRVESGIPGVYFTKSPPSQAHQNGNLMVELNPFDIANVRKVAGSGLYLADMAGFQQFQTIIQTKGLTNLVNEINI